MAKILVVDDYNDTADSMAQWLKLHGHDVQIARNGPQAIETALSQKPRYVLLDIGLPRLDGCHVATVLRTELPRSLVIIAISGHGREEDRRRALMAGCDHYFLKPIDHNVLLDLIPAPDMSLESPEDNHTSNGAMSHEDGVVERPTRVVEITNALGLHLRACDKMIRLARQFQSDIRIVFGDRTASGRSILDLTMLAAECGSRLELTAEGPDATAALDALTKLIECRFDEQE